MQGFYKDIHHRIPSRRTDGLRYLINFRKMVLKAHLDLIANLFQSTAVTPKTLRLKDYQWRVYTDYCRLYQEQPVPASGDTLVRFSIFLIVRRNCTVPVVKNYLKETCKNEDNPNNEDDSKIRDDIK